MSTADEKRAYERCHKRPTCQARIAKNCRERNEHAHHRKLRSQGGPTTDNNLLAVCRPCHDWIHAHPAASRFRGLLIPSWVDNDDIRPFVGTP